MCLFNADRTMTSIYAEARFNEHVEIFLARNIKDTRSVKRTSAKREILDGRLRTFTLGGLVRKR